MVSKTFKGFKKVPQYEDILKVQLGNAHKYLYLPERYMFLPTQVAEASGDMARELEDQKQRVHRASRADADDRMGDTPVPLTRLTRGERGERGEQGEQGPRGVTGPPGAPTYIDLDPVIRTMHQRLDAAEAVRATARDKELQDELSLIRMEAQRHAETARVLAQASANLTSIPSELRAVAKATAQQASVDTLSHLHQAVAHIDRRAQDSHETNVQFLHQNAHDLARFAGQMGQGLINALHHFRPPDRQHNQMNNQMIIINQPPPPPPPPDAARIKRAAIKALPPPPPPDAARSGPTDGPERLAIADIPPSSGRPGSSTDPTPRSVQAGPYAKSKPPVKSKPTVKQTDAKPAPPAPPAPVGGRTFDFGGPAPHPTPVPAPATGGITFDFGGPSTLSKDEQRRNRDRNRVAWKAQHARARTTTRAIGTTRLVKEKEKTAPPAGLSVQATTKEHTEKLTTHGMKPIVAKVEDVFHARGTKRRQPPKHDRSDLRKPGVDHGPPDRRRRRLSISDV